MKARRRATSPPAIPTPAPTGTPAVATRRLGHPVVALVGQLALIVVGVFLGLQADEWRDRRKQDALRASTLRAFRDEVAHNREALARVLPYHRAMGDALTEVWKRHQGSGVPLTLGALRAESRYDGLRLPELAGTAYDLAVATQVLGSIDQPLVLLLSRTYERQRALARYQDQLGTALMTSPELARGDWQRGAYLLAEGLSEVRAAEDVLLAKYDSVLARLAPPTR